MLTTPTTTTIQYCAPTDDIFKNEMTSSQSPSDGFVGLPPPPPPPPAPPVFNTNNNNTNNLCKILLPHQEVNLVVNRENVTEIQARSVPTMFMSGSNIWTRRVLPSLRIKQTVFDQHYGESKSTMTNHYRRSSLTTSYLGGGGGGGGGLGGTSDDGALSYVLLDAASKMLYDVPMRHLLQLVKKDHDDDASIDHVIRAIDETHMKSEWLDAVTALNKQFDKRPEDKARVLAHKGSTHGLVLIEQFFVKLVRVPAYEFKLIYLKFREEAPTQLERMSKHINDLLESVQAILNNEQLPGILHLLCLLYNSVTGKTIPGLHFDSLLSVLSTRTPKQNTTVAHVLCHLLEEQYPTLLNIFDNQILLKLKDFSAIKYVPIYIDIRLLYTRYKQLNTTLRELQQQLIILPEHIKTTLADLQVIFTKLFDDENKIKKCEKDLASYFCLWDLSLEVCFSTLGQFMDKLRLAHMQNVEQHRRNELLFKQQQQQQRLYENRIVQTPTTARLLRNSQSQYGSDTNIFRDHLNVPLTPTTARQRSKVNKSSRERFCGSSRDISYTNDEEQEQIEAILRPTTIRTQNLLPNAIPRKRGHSPTTKTVLTKRPFNALPACTSSTTTTIAPDQSSDDVFVSPIANDEHEDDNDSKMDCSVATTITAVDEKNSIENMANDDHLLPSNESTTRVISVCEIQPSFYLTTPIRRLFDPSNDQSTLNDTFGSVEYTYNSNNTTTPASTNIQQMKYLSHENENNKENSIYLSTLTPLTSSSSSSLAAMPNTIEFSSSPNYEGEDSQQSSSSSSPVDTSNEDNRCLPTIPLLLSDSETLDEGFETQSNVSETVEPTSKPCQLETTQHEIRETESLSNDETLADELTRRLTFNSNRRLSHDSNIRHANSRRTLLTNGRPTSLLKTSTSAYSYPTFILSGQQHQENHKSRKRTPSVESLRATLLSGNAAFNIRSSRHIQRCAVSRRIWTENETDDTSKPNTTSPPPPSSSSSLSITSTLKTSIEPDELSSSSTITTTTTTTTTTTADSTMNNHRISSIKPKSKIRNLHTLTDSVSRSHSPIIRKVSSRLGHANSCQNVSTTTNNSPKSSPLAKNRSPQNVVVNNSQILRSSFSRVNDKPLRACHTPVAANNESASPNRPSPRARRLFSSNSDIDSSATSSPRSLRKPPSSWHHHKAPQNKTTINNDSPSSDFNVNRKTSASTNDLRKTNATATNVFQRVTQPKRL